MKRYIKADSDSRLLSRLGITAEDLKIIKEWCDNYDPDSDVGFEFNDQYITNPLIDASGRFEYDITKAVEVYGLDNIKNFCKQVLAASNGLYEIWIASSTTMNGEDEWDVVSTSMGFTETGITSYDINELKQYLSKHQMSQVSDDGTKVVCEVALIAAYDAEIGDFNCVAYQTYDGQIIDG